jgi:adenine deaminase
MAAVQATNGTAKGTGMSRDELIRRIPKVELHVHLEGTLEPDLAFALSERNGVPLPFASADSMKAAYEFTDLQSFLDVYYASCSVLRTEQDFYDLTWAYLLHADADNVRHVEPFFDPQTHTARGVAYDDVVGGIRRALADGRSALGITSKTIMCVLRDLPEHDAMATLTDALRSGLVDGMGLDSGEVGNPPGGFARVFAKAHAAGLHLVAHAGEEGPASYIAESIDVLKAERIDHGVRVLDDPALVERLAAAGTCFTVCPTSNLALRVVDTLEAHPLRRMLDAGLRVTVNSDDPAYFGGYLHDTFVRTAEALDLTDEQVVTLARNAIDGSFASAERKEELRAELALATE